MKHKATDVRNYNFTEKDQLFLDANIWLYIHSPQKPGNYWEKIYSNVLKRILNANSQIYIDILVVSEYINSYARRKMNLIASRFKYFKKFRNSHFFKPIAKDIETNVKLVLKHCTLIESGFATLAIDDLLADYTSNHSDFNDLVIIELCKSNGFTLITNDSDFKTQEIPVLTANNALLTN